MSPARNRGIGDAIRRRPWLRPAGPRRAVVQRHRRSIAQRSYWPARKNFVRSIRRLVRRPVLIVNHHHDVWKKRHSLLFGPDYSRHRFERYYLGIDIGPFRLIYRSSPFYRGRRYQYVHLPIGDSFRPVGYDNHFHYDYHETSFTPVVVYANEQSHHLDQYGFCTAHEHHHHNHFDSQQAYMDMPAAILEYWWIDTGNGYDDLRLLFDMSEYNEGLQLSYAQIVVEVESADGQWNEIMVKPIEEIYDGSINEYGRLQVESDLGGYFFGTDRTYRVYLVAYYGQDGVEDEEIVTSNPIEIRLANID